MGIRVKQYLPTPQGWDFINASIIRQMGGFRDVLHGQIAWLIQQKKWTVTKEFFYKGKA